MSNFVVDYNWSFTPAPKSEVHIVLANDQNDKDHILFVTTNQTVAEELFSALNAADTECVYDYRVTHRAMAR